MTVNYTTNLALGQPVTGTESGTWGDDVNNALTAYLDIAIAGTLSFSGDGSVTLANTQGTNLTTNIGATTAQYMVLRFTGTLTTTKVVTGPSTSKLYMVDNSTSGGFGVTIKATGQTGYTVAAGTKAWVYYNGTDYVQIDTNDISKLTGILPIANGGTNTSSTPTAGAVAYGTGTAYAFNSAGTSGQALLSGGAGTPTFGTVGIGAGGTALTTTPTNGQILIGNGTNYTLSTLTAGSGVTITNGSGSITIAASGASTSTGGNMYLAANFGAF